MATTDALPVPIWGVAYRITFALRLNTGALNNGATGLAAKVSRDSSAPGNSTNTPTEIGSGFGMYYLDLTTTEMQAQTVAVTVTSTSTNAVPYSSVLLTHQPGVGDIPVDVSTIVGDATAAANQSRAANAIIPATVVTATYTPTVNDFETNLTTSVATDFYKGRSVVFTAGGSGSLAGQAARVIGSSFTNSKVRLTVTPLTAAPVNNQLLLIL